MADDVTHMILDGDLHFVARVDAMRGADHTERVFLGCGITTDVRDDWRTAEAATMDDHRKAREPRKPDKRELELIAQAKELGAAEAVEQEAFNVVADEHAAAIRDHEEQHGAGPFRTTPVGARAQAATTKLEEATKRRETAGIAHAEANRAVHEHRNTPARPRRFLTHSASAPVTATCPTCVDVEAGTAAPLAHAPAPSITIEADIPTGLNCEICQAPLLIRRKDGTVVCTAQGHEFTVPEVLGSSMKLLQKLAKREI